MFPSIHAQYPRTAQRVSSPMAAQSLTPHFGASAPHGRMDLRDTMDTLSLSSSSNPYASVIDPSGAKLTETHSNQLTKALEEVRSQRFESAQVRANALVQALKNDKHFNKHLFAKILTNQDSPNKETLVLLVPKPDPVAGRRKGTVNQQATREKQNAVDEALNQLETSMAASWLKTQLPKGCWLVDASDLTTYHTSSRDDIAALRLKQVAATELSRADARATRVLGKAQAAGTLETPAEEGVASIATSVASAPSALSPYFSQADVEKIQRTFERVQQLKIKDQLTRGKILIQLLSKDQAFNQKYAISNISHVLHKDKPAVAFIRPRSLSAVPLAPGMLLAATLPQDVARDIDELKAVAGKVGQNWMLTDFPPHYLLMDLDDSGKLYAANNPQDMAALHEKHKAYVEA